MESLRVSFVALAVFVALLFVGAVYWSSTRTGSAPAATRAQTALAAFAAGAWLALTGFAAASGWLHFTPPPTMMVVFPVVFALAFGIAFSRLGKRIALGLPVAALVSYQGFRVAVELLMHQAYSLNLMPVQMSYSGRNFDILTGITALMLGGYLATLGERWPRRLVLFWNTFGLALLVNIIVVALLSAPTPMRRFMNEPANVWITQAPWVWLPTVMVLAALTGHLLVYRRVFSAMKPTAPRP